MEVASHWTEKNRAFRAKKLAKCDRGERAVRTARKIARDKARRLKSVLSDEDRRAIDAHAARLRRRLAAGEKRGASSKLASKKHAKRDARRIDLLVVESEIAIIEGMAKEGGSVEKYLNESTTVGATSEDEVDFIMNQGDAVKAKLCDSSIVSDSSEILVEGDIQGLLNMDIQDVDVDASFGVECFRVDAFSW